MSTQDKPRIAYVLLWFPLASETFIFREVQNLEQLEICAYTMYGEAFSGCSQAMRDYSGSVTRFGLKAFFKILAAFGRNLCQQPQKVSRLMGQGLWRRMRNLEAFGENTWCFLAGFLLAELCVRDQIQLIHAPWANGPATAAWIASELTGIPFVFSGRAGDIYPEDGLLAEKAAAARAIRTNNAANVAWLRQFCLPDQKDKVRLVYNGLTFGRAGQLERRLPEPPYKILAVGRFARTKGFPELLTALARLRRENFPARLTLVGDGCWKRKLQKMLLRLRLEGQVDLPGFVPNDRLAHYMTTHDLLVVPSVVYANGDRDGIPNVIMEASSLGLPVVATDVCGIGEVIVDQKTGRLVPQRSPAALASAIRQQLENPQQALAMAANARERVRQMFDPERNAQALAKLYLTHIQPSPHV